LFKRKVDARQIDGQQKDRPGKLNRFKINQNILVLPTKGASIWI